MADRAAGPPAAATRARLRPGALLPVLIRAAAAVSVVLGLVFLAGCAPRTPPRLVIQTFDDCVFADLSANGTEARRIREIVLRDAATGAVVWQARASGEDLPRMFELKLCRGWNPILPEMIGSKRRFTYTITSGGERFLVETGRRYLLEARGEGGELLSGAFPGP